MRKSWTLLFLVAMSLGSAGCGLVGAGGPPGTGAAITITNSFKSVQAGSAPITLNAFGPTGHPLPVSWSLTFSDQPCAPVCGTLVTSDFSTAVYTPPATSPRYGQATITVQSGGNIWVDDIQITPGIGVSIANKFTTQYVGGPQVTVTAVVSNDSTGAGVMWTLTAGGASCAPACGTLTPGSGGLPFTAVYAPPPALPSGANITPMITASSVTSPTTSDSFSFTLASASGLLKGSYALLLRGYYLTGAPMAIAGSITADGNGNITGGEFDVNNDGGITHIASPATGTYSVDLSFNGATRGRIVIASFTFPGSNNGIAFDFVLSADGKRGKAVEADGSAFINSGEFLQQDPTALSAANAAGTYAFELDSDAPVGGRIVEAGRFVLAATGITGGLVDRSAAGAAAPIYSNVSLGPGTATAPDSSGRGTLTITVPAQGATVAESVLYSYYLVNASQLNLIEIDSGATTGVQAGAAYAQKIPPSAAATSVLQLTGMDTIPSQSCTGQQQPNCIAPDAIIGVLTITAGNAFTFTFDENDMGKILNKHSAQGTVTFDTTTGRGIFSDPGGFENGFMDSSVFYMYDTGKAVVIDADISTCVTGNVATNSCVPPIPPTGPITNNAFSGTFVPQAAGPFSETSLNGNLIGGSGASAIPDIPDVAALIVADGSGNFNVQADLDTSNSQVGNLQNYPFVGTYSAPDPTLGYGTVSLPAFVFDSFVTGPASASFYLVGPNQAVMIGTQPGVFSGVSVLDPP